MKYQQIIDAIISRIKNKEYQPNDKLPTTEALCKEYGVSKITVTRAMDELVTMGYIARRRGSGTYVKALQSSSAADASGRNMSAQMDGFTREHEGLGEKVTSKIIQFCVVNPPKDVAQNLSISEDDFCYYIERVRLGNGKAMALEHTYMPVNLIPGLTKTQLLGSIYGYIEKDLGLKINSAHRTIEAVRAEGSLAKDLNVHENMALMQVTQIGFLDDGRAFEQSTSWHIEHYKFYAVSIR